MKRYLSVVALMLLGAVPLLRGEAPANYTPESRFQYETFTSKVLRVYSFEDGDYQYAAYVVNWKDHEIVVEPISNAGKRPLLKVGDPIRCAMQQTFHKVDGADKGYVTFHIVESPSASGTEPTPQGRLDAVRAEVEKRRAEREMAAAQQGGSPVAPAPAPVQQR